MSRKTFQQRIDQLRKRRTELLDAQKDIRAGRVRREEAATRLRELIRRRAALFVVDRARPLVQGLAAPEQRYADDRVIGDVKQLESALCFYFGDVIEARLVAEMDEAVDFSSSRPLDGRDQELQRIDAEVLVIEIQEEELVRQSESEGEAIARRPDARGDVMLGFVG